MLRSILGARQLRRVCAHLLCGALCVASVTLAHAEDNTPSTTPPQHADAAAPALDLLIEHAWDVDPTLRAAGLSAQAQRQRAKAATRERGDLQVDAGVGLMTMGSEMAPTWMLSASVGTEFRPARLNQAEAHIADVRAGAFECGAVVRALTVRAEVEQLVLRAETLQKEEALLDTELAQVRSIEKLLKTQSQQGLAVLSLAVRVESLLASIEQRAFALEAERLSLEAAWQALAPDSNLEALQIETAWFQKAPSSLESLELRDVQAVLRHWEREELQAAQGVEEASRRIRWRVGGSYARSAMMTSPMDMVPSHTAMAMVGVAIPRTSATNSRISALEAEREAIATQDGRSARDTQRDAQTLIAEHAALEQQLERIETRLEPLTAALQQAFERSLLSGQRAWSEYVDAVLATTEVSRNAVELGARIQALRIELDTLSDGQLSGRAPLLTSCARGDAPEVTP